jgi:hypothetical protein
VARRRVIDGQERANIQAGGHHGEQNSPHIQQPEGREVRCGVGAHAAAGQEGQVAPRLVHVEWLDSFGCSATWQPLDVDRPSPLLCRSVGWVLYDGPDCKVIVPHVSRASDPPQGCGDMTIPSVAIVKLTDLTEFV